jgi:hypothetical protein
VRDKCTPSDIILPPSRMLPLHFLLHFRSPISEVSEEGGCLRLLLRFYPAAAGIKETIQGVHMRWLYQMILVLTS